MKITINNKATLDSISNLLSGYSCTPFFQSNMPESPFGKEEIIFDEDEDGKFERPIYWEIEGEFSTEQLLQIGRRIERFSK